ncbi:MAG: sensor histidine kinase, partial [Pleurocapsa sp.]
RQSYQLIQQFTADAAHELRTPLAAIRATVESTLMIHNLTEAETKETLEAIGRQNIRLSNLVADLLMLCRMDRQLNVANSSIEIKEQIDLVSLIKDIVEDFSLLAHKSEIRLDMNLFVIEPLMMIGNYEQLYRMVSNLVSNALKCTTTGGQIQINLTLDRSCQYALIKVEDTGVGISPEDLNKIFTRFYRVNSDRSRETGGSGLGLSIAQAVAQAHQGTIKVDSKLGKGSIFTVLLPVKKHDFA